MKNNKMNNYKKYGFLIIKNKTLRSYIQNAKEIYLNNFKKRFGNDPKVNRELIKRFADHPNVSSIYTSKTMIEIIKKNIGFKIPIKCGPLVSHYTSNNKTGNSYGLPFHQDYPSMASSKQAIILWLNLVDSNEDTHGIELLPGLHRNGLLEGARDSSGYILEKKFNEFVSVIPSIKAGDLLIMSCFLPHKTFVNPNYSESGWKLSLSQRFDDLADKNWAARGYQNAYKVVVDRELYLNDDQNHINS